jgi:hypothetical protein
MLLSRADTRFAPLGLPFVYFFSQLPRLAHYGQILTPSLRKDITHGAGDSLKTLATANLRRFHNIVEYEVAFVERIVRPRELDRAASVSF